MKSIKQYKEVFILGIGGSGMSSIAKYLHQRGAIVKGYDQRSSYVTNLLENDGVITTQNIDNEKYNEDVLYVISSAIKIGTTFLKNYESKENKDNSNNKSTFFRNTTNIYFTITMSMFLIFMAA